MCFLFVLFKHPVYGEGSQEEMRNMLIFLALKK